MGVFVDEEELEGGGSASFCLLHTAQEGLEKIEIWSSCCEECVRLNNMPGEARAIPGFSSHSSELGLLSQIFQNEIHLWLDLMREELCIEFSLIS